MRPRFDSESLRSHGKKIWRHLVLPFEVGSGAAVRSDTDFMPDTAAAMFQGPPRVAYLILRGFLVFLFIAIIWAAFSDLDEITVGEGKVIPSSHVQVIQNLEGGIVSKIPVKVGDVVEKGQIVLNLDETRFSSSFGETKAKYYALLARISRLTAETNNTKFEPPAELLKEEPKIAEDELAFYKSRQNELDANLAVLRQQAGQRSQELVEKRARFQQLQESYSLLSQELKMSKPLVAQGVLSEVEILRLERQVNDLRGEMDATRLAIPRLEGSFTEARNKIEGALAKFRSDAANDLNLARAEFAGTSASSVAMKDRLERTAVRSPVAGIVKTLKVTTIGGVIQPGMDVMEIVPIEDNFLIEAKVRPADVGFLRPGQETMVKLSAYDFSIYGGLDGVLENITADSITNDKGESFYLVRVRSKVNKMGGDAKPLTVIPGMLATVHIRTGYKSVLSYLLKPVLKAKQEALRER